MRWREEPQCAPGMLRLNSAADALACNLDEANKWPSLVHRTVYLTAAITTLRKVHEATAIPIETIVTMKCLRVSLCHEQYIELNLRARDSDVGYSSLKVYSFLWAAFK